MKILKRYFVAWSAVLFLICITPAGLKAQESATVLAGAELTRVTPPGFYFQGLSAPTQMRNTAAARFGSKRYVIVGLVDTSGYSSDVRAKYEGFFITDSAISINGTELATGAYGFGFSDDGKMQILDLAGNRLFSVATTRHSALRRPRPLMMVKAADGLRLYSGKDYVVIAAR
jgi:hypothetical protein